MKSAFPPLIVSSLLGLTACESEPDGGLPPAMPSDVASNIVIITLDTTRADHLGSYGYFRDTSPSLDALAGESLLFERCVSPTASTLPAHTSLLTGATLTEHGVLTNMSFGAAPRWAQWGLRSFAQIALDGGYQTAAVVSASPVKKGTGLELGFVHFDQPEGLERPAVQTTDAALAWLEQRREGPYLLWVHLWDPHHPLVAPEPFTHFEGDVSQRDAELARRGVPDQEWRLRTGDSLSSGGLVDAYDAEIRYMDAEIGRLLTALRADPSWDRTAVVVMGDHGEGVGQHEVLEHGSLWWEQVHVPLIMRVPGLQPQRVDRLLGLADVLPTLVARLGQPDLAPGAAASGRDVLAPGAPSLPLLVSAPGHVLDSAPHVCSLVTEKSQLMLPAPGNAAAAPLLFDLVQDPHQQHDLAAAQPETVAKLSALVSEPCAALLRSAEQVGSASEQTEAMKRLSEELRALGYVD